MSAEWPQEKGGVRGEGVASASRLLASKYRPPALVRSIHNAPEASICDYLSVIAPKSARSSK
jgi:hypothetical protein